MTYNFELVYLKHTHIHSYMYTEGIHVYSPINWHVLNIFENDLWIM